MDKFPLLRLVEWLGGNRVRLFYSTGRVIEVRLPVASAKRARIVDYGMGLDPGDGLDMSADGLYDKGKIVGDFTRLRKGRKRSTCRKRTTRRKSATACP